MVGMLLIMILVLIIIAGVYQISNAKFTMSYLYGNYDYIALVERTQGALNEVSPSYFDLDNNGDLVLNPVSNQLVTQMHAKGITVVPFLSNHWDRGKGRSALKNREKLVNQIVSAIQQYQLDGVNVDIENLTEVDKDNYTAFVKLLKERLPNDKALSVAVAANPNGWNYGWQGSYDYKALGEIADDIVLMAYDEHFEGGVPGPVASISFVEASVKEALKYVPSNKLVLGVPFYGRYWNTNTRKRRRRRHNEQNRKYGKAIPYSH